VQIDAPAGVSVVSVRGERVDTAVQKTGDFTSSSDLLTDIRTPRRTRS